MSEPKRSWISADPANRQKDDFYPTPPEATRALLSVETFDGMIWEPACGDGAMSKVLRLTHNVFSSDLNDYGYGTPGVDFLLQNNRRAPLVVTNPPFKLAQQFAEHALGLPRRRWSYRNYFAADNGSPDWHDWRELERRGFAKMYLRDKYLDFFFVTKKGLAYYGLLKKVRKEDIYGDAEGKS